MDEKDRKIIAALRENAKMPIRKISKRVHITESAIRKRVKRLEREGVIEGYTVVANPSKLGYSTMAVVGLDVEPEKCRMVIKELTSLEDVKRLAILAGEHTIMGEVLARDNKELTDIVLRKIGGIEGVTKVHTSVILERIKG